MNTVQSFPRTPEEAGIIPVKLKRKLEYKNDHIEQYISTKKIFEALNTLKNLGNKYYQFVTDLDSYKRKCRKTDPDGFDFIFNESEEVPAENDSIDTEVPSEDENEEEDNASKHFAKK